MHLISANDAKRIKNKSTFLAMDYLLLKWLDGEQNIHVMNLQSLRIKDLLNK
ncbi:hypothetical protein [Bacillus sp. FSL L8-0152]|uniref:hypothetical protein n=1 Tax=Bacillus sp. FSL L8-0152 TaxID=2921516 RepID=UPI0030FBEB87